MSQAAKVFCVSAALALAACNLGSEQPPLTPANGSETMKERTGPAPSPSDEEANPAISGPQAPQGAGTMGSGAGTPGAGSDAPGAMGSDIPGPRNAPGTPETGSANQGGRPGPSGPSGQGPGATVGGPR